MERPGILGVSSENLHEEKARKDAYDSALFWLDIGRAEFASDGLFRGYSQKLVDKSCYSGTRPTSCLGTVRKPYFS